MANLKRNIEFETAFGIYTVDSLLGEGGAGRVYGGLSSEGDPIAVKLLAEERATADKRRRFKKEISFLARCKHRNIVAVLDHGVARGDRVAGPFYVMSRYDRNLRHLMQSGIDPGTILSLFAQLLDGVEAAHMQNVVHRDLKPENILHDDRSGVLAIADFGVARFLEDSLVTAAVTAPNQRLANFQYAAPEQRVAGRAIGASSDLFALGLILNEMFTGEVPHGTGYRLVGSVAEEFGFLDEIVAQLIRQAPGERPPSIAALKGLIQRHELEAVSLQKLSRIDGTVIGEYEVDNPLADQPPRLVNADWDGSRLTLFLDRAVTREWIEALRQMGSYSSLMGKGPETFVFQGDKAFVSASDHEVQQVINLFKGWLPAASQNLKRLLEQAAKKKEAQQKEALRRERELEERRLRLLRTIKI